MQTTVHCPLTALKTSRLVDRFSDAAKKFGLTISIKKTELMFQPRPNEDHYDPVVTIDDTELASVKNFCYLVIYVFQWLT